MKPISDRIILFLDFDGTIVPLAPTPDAVVVSPDTLQILSKLVQTGGCVPGIISGRALSDLKNKLGPFHPRLLAANHGLEWSIDGRRFRIHFSLNIQRHMANFRRVVDGFVRQYPQLLLEDKGLSFAVHYRNLQLPIRTGFMHDWKNSVQPELPSDLEILSNKKVFEIRPRIAWSKADIVALMLQYVGTSDQHLIYIGDDNTDESVFIKFPTALTVRVGFKKGSHARYFIRNINEVHLFLMTLADMLT